MKRLLLIVLTGALLSLAGCGSSSGDTNVNVSGEENKDNSTDSSNPVTEAAEDVRETERGVANVNLNIGKDAEKYMYEINGFYFNIPKDIVIKNEDVSDENSIDKRICLELKFQQDEYCALTVGEKPYLDDFEGIESGDSLDTEYGSYPIFYQSTSDWGDSVRERSLLKVDNKDVMLQIDYIGKADYMGILKELYPRLVEERDDLQKELIYPDTVDKEVAVDSATCDYILEGRKNILGFINSDDAIEVEIFEGMMGSNSGRYLDVRDKMNSIDIISDTSSHFDLLYRYYIMGDSQYSRGDTITDKQEVDRIETQYGEMIVYLCKKENSTGVDMYYEIGVLQNNGGLALLELYDYSSHEMAYNGKIKDFLNRLGMLE